MHKSVSFKEHMIRNIYTKEVTHWATSNNIQQDSNAICSNKRTNTTHRRLRRGLTRRLGGLDGPGVALRRGEDEG
jgi:hypothetical protein